MKASLKSLVSIFIVAIFGLGVAWGSTESENVEWKARMRAMLGDVLVLFPLAFDEAKFSDPKNAVAIQTSLKSLSQHSSELKKHTAHISKDKGLKIDPSFPFIADSFENEILLAQTGFSGDKKNALESQVALRSALAKCMLCHTQSANGPELKLDQFKTQFAAFSPTDRFMALTVTRQFDDALSEFQKYAKDSRVKKPDPSVFDKNTRTALAISVRVKRDPKRTLSLLEQIGESDAGSNMLKSDLKGWRKSVLAWSGEKALALNSDKALFDDANRLIDFAKNQQARLEVYEDSSIYYLRASANLHDLLSNYPNSPLRAQSYMSLANIYSQLPSFSMWDMGDEYLGACIRENPHSEMGEKCSEAYEDSITFGYTGSSGTHIPGAVRKHLEDMKALGKRPTKKR